VDALSMQVEQLRVAGKFVRKYTLSLNAF
jgi:hypothetical protein